MHRTAAFAAVLVGTSMTLVGCASRRQAVSVTLENRSSAQLEVEVDLPSKGVFGRKPNHEAFRTLLPPGQMWQNGPDTLRFATEPNDVQGFRVLAADIGGAERVWFAPFPVPGSRKECHVIFSGRPGDLYWSTPGGREERLQVYR